MARNHIHLAAGFHLEVISGMRKNCTLFIEIDIEKAMMDDIKFYKSSNNVILTSGVCGILDKKYFKSVKSNGMLQHL